MRKAFIILTGIIFTLLTATCKQFTADIDDYLGYWAAETYITDSSIKAVVQNDVNSIASVPSAEDVPITFMLQNPKSFPLDLPPEADAEKNVIVFEHLPKAPAAGRAVTLHTDTPLPRMPPTSLSSSIRRKRESFPKRIPCLPIILPQGLCARMGFRKRILPLNLLWMIWRSN